MAEKEKDPARVVLKNVRLSFPALWKAKPFAKGKEGEPKFQGSFLMDKDDKLQQKNIAKMEDAIEFVKGEKWPKGAPKFAAGKICLRDGDDLEEPIDGYENCMYVSSSNSRKPRVLDADGLDAKEGDEGAPYAGCYVDAIVRVWAQDNDYGKRINASIEGVKFRDDGDSFGGGRPVTDDDFDDDDDEPAPKRRSRSEDEDEKPKRRSRDEDDEPAPKRRSRDEEDEPAPKRRSRDEDDEPAPKRRSRDEDDEPAPKRRSRDDDDEPAPKRRSRDEDEEDERPARRRSRDEEDEPAPRRRRSRDDDLA